MFTSFDHHTTYIVCMLTATPITFSLACLYTTTICVCILTALYHRMIYIQPGYSYHSLLFIHSFVSTQQPYAPAYSRHSTTIPYIYAACMLTKSLVTCVMFCLFVFTPLPYAPAYSRHSTTAPHICSLNAQCIAYHVSLVNFTLSQHTLYHHRSSLQTHYFTFHSSLSIDFIRSLYDTFTPPSYH